MKNLKKFKGYSLIELLVAMSLGVFIIGTSLSFFETSRKTQKVQSELSEVRENAQFALDIIKEDIQLAGFFGCATRWQESGMRNTLNEPHNDFRWNFSQSITGSEYIPSGEGSSESDEWSPLLHDTISSSQVFRGDTITIRHADRREFGVVQHNTADDPVKIRGGNEIKQYDYLLVTDCEYSSIFQKTNSTEGSASISHGTAALGAKYAGNSTTDLGKQYSSNAKVMKLLSITYFISKKSGKIPALYRKEGERKAQEILTGIIDLQFEYGVDEDGDDSIDAYYTADQVQANNWWDSVIIVRVNLIAQGFRDDIATGEESQRFSNNAELKYSISASVNLRNRLP